MANQSIYEAFSRLWQHTVSKITTVLQPVKDALEAHIEDESNPHKVTKDQVGLGNVTNDAQVKRSEMGVANGVATLDDNGLVPSSQLPSYVDDVINGYLSNGKFYSDLGLTSEITPEDHKIYIDLTNSANLTYRWSGTAYVEISKSLALGETEGTAYRGDRGKTAYDHSQMTSGNPHGVTKSDVGLDKVENKSSEEIRGELTAEDVTDALGFTPADSGEVAQSDYDQNDNSQPDFIKNRPFYSEVTGETLALSVDNLPTPESTIEGKTYYVIEPPASAINNQFLVEGKSYKVVWGGTEYLRTARDDGFGNIYIGNQSLCGWEFSEPITSDEPFFIATHEESQYVGIFSTELGPRAVQMYDLDEIVHPISKKYIPESVLPKSPDWLDNDQTSKTHVMNRTHYATLTGDSTELIAETEVDFGEFGEHSLSVEYFIPGEVYRVTYDEVEYTCTAWTDAEDNICLGGDGYPFIIKCFAAD